VANAAVSQADEDGFTPLYIACQNGHLEIVRLLLEASAAINRAPQHGATPLYMACGKGHLDIVRLLLEASASINQAQENGATPLYVACQEGATSTSSGCFSRRARRPAKPATTAPRRCSSRARRATSRSRGCCAAPALQSIKPRRTAPRRCSSRARRATWLECARLLLEANAAVNQARNDGVTPLIMACAEDYLEVVQLLSSYGASRAAVPPLCTPEEIATEEGHADLAAWLVASRDWTPLQHLEGRGVPETSG